MHDRDQAALECAAALLNMEAKIDETLASAADLMGQLARGRVRAGLSATTGQEVFERAAAIFTAGVQMRAAAVTTHNGLEAVRRMHKITSPVMVGGLDKPPQDAPGQFMRTEPLRVVAEESAA